jgi:polyketide cyclase/dehydrase/lipid transport protein
MTTFASAQATSTAAPERFFEIWADMATWPEWNADTEWVRLDGPFQTGATGVLKPKGGPKVKFTVASVVPGREFVDVSHLMGSKLTFDHQVMSTPDGGATVRVTISFRGPMAWFWKRIIGGGMKASVQRDLDSLVAVAESPARV